VTTDSVILVEHCLNREFLETIAVCDGEIKNLKYHQQRYESVLKTMGIDEFEDLSSYIEPPVVGLYKCRLVYTKESIKVSYHPYEKKEISKIKIVFDNDIQYPQKSLLRDDLERLYKQRDGCDEILIVKNLLVSDTSIANIAFYDEKQGIWITPKQPLLKGTTRQRLLDEGKIFPAEIKVHTIRQYSKIALLNAMVGFDILPRHEFLI